MQLFATNFYIEIAFIVISQTCHSIELKNLDLTNKKSGSGEKNRDHGPIGKKRNNSPKETTICSFFLLLSHKECFDLSDQFVCALFMSFLSVCVVFVFMSVPSDQPIAG